MRINKRLWVVPVVICLAVGIVGCGNGDADPAGGNGGRAADPGTSNGTNGNVIDPDQSTLPEVEPPPPPTIPEVRLTTALRATCVLFVGHTMPEAELPGLDGQVYPLRPLYGEKLTVVCFWSLGSTTTTQVFAGVVLEDLAEDIAKPYADKGVRVIAVNEGDSAQNVDALSVEVGVKQTLQPILLDPDGTLFAQVANEKLPRIYVLDAEGKILWFDMEYSEITRDELLQTIQVALGEI